MMGREQTTGCRISVTRTLLEKDEGSLTDAERAAVAEYREWLDVRDDMLGRENARISGMCTMLCRFARTPIPDFGWMHPVKEMCLRLEAMNYRYSRYGLRVVLDQSKEKFGTLRFYTHMETRRTGLWGAVERLSDFISGAIGRCGLKRLSMWLDRLVTAALPDTAREVSVMEGAFAAEVDSLVSATERDCESLCQHCGSTLGDRCGHERCETCGWISYLCERCAIASGAKYVKGGKTYLEGAPADGGEKA